MTMLFLAAGAEAHDVAIAVLTLAVIAAIGLALGSVRIRGIGLGTAGVLFAGIAFGHIGATINPTILAFVREFGLILFVFCIGLQLGPAFFASLQRDGLRLNLLAAAIVLLGAGAAVASGWLLGIDPSATLGLFSGATTNTPSLGAAQQALSSLGTANDPRAALPALAYAVSYPVGIVGIITSLLVLRTIFRINPVAEAEAARAEQRRDFAPIERRNLIVENENLDGLRLREVPGRAETQVVVSRIRHRDETTVHAATPDTLLQVGDSLLAVGTAAGLNQFRRIVGRVGDEDLMAAPSEAAFQRVFVTRPEVLGKRLDELGIEQTHGVTVSRFTRGDLEMPASAEMRLQFGDTLQVVGPPDRIAAAAAALGNSMKALNETQFIPLFVGIAAGVIAGMHPLDVPGLPAPLKLGLAGGPLVLALILGRVGHFGQLVWHMPLNSNLAFRELGIVLFLACVGLNAGAQFFATVFTLNGLLWLLSATIITVLPLLGVGLFARQVWGLNYTAISGLLAGSMTDPPALAFANTVCKSDAPAVSYATVYPLTMLLRIVLAQLLALWLWKLVP